MHRKLLSWLSAVLMVLGVLVPALTALAHHSPGEWNVSVSAPQYQNGNTIYTYTISATGQPHALSHFNLGYCAEWGSITTTPPYDEIGDDPPTGMSSVIKWERSVENNQTLTITLTLTGLWAPGSQPWLVKTGQGDFPTTGPGSLAGPSCSQLAPDFAISKKVSLSESGPWADEITLAGGGMAYYRYVFTNTGNTPLTISEAIDDKLGNITYPSDPVPVGGSVILGPVSKSFPSLAPGSADEEEVNTITVNATHEGSTYGPRTDTAKVINLAPDGSPSFAITKSVSMENDPATGSKLVELTGGGTVYYFYTLTNTGNVPLTLAAENDSVFNDFTFGVAALNPGQSISVTLPWTYPALNWDSPPQQVENIISVTMSDSAGYTETKSDQAMVINYPPRGEPAFAVTKGVAATNNPDAAGPNLELQNGGTAYYFYTVTNTGQVNLRITSAMDDKLGPITFTPELIEPGQTAYGTASKTFPSLSPGSAIETEVNEITVGAISLPDEEEVGPHTAQATVLNYPPRGEPDFTVTKRVSATDDPATGQESVTLSGGGTVYYFYTITNTGQTALTITSAVDDKLGSITFAPNRIEPGQSATGTAQKSFAPLGPGASETELNIISVTAQTDDSQTVGPKADQATVINNGPARSPDFTITKAVSLENDPSTGTKSVELTGGGTVYYFYTLTNVGNVPLSITAVADTVISPVSFGVSILNPTDSVTITVPWTFAPLHWDSPSQQVENVISVTMTDNASYTETKSDRAMVTNYPPPPPGEASFTLTKQVGATNNPDAAGPNLTLQNGGTAYYFYAVTNTGEVDLRITSAIDDKLGAITFTPEVIQPGQTAYGTAAKSFPTLAPGGAPVTEVNVITVGAISLPDEEEVGPHSARATVINYPPPPPPSNPNFTVTKAVSTTNDPATGQTSVSIQGGTVYYFYTVTNTGDVSIQLTSATDDKLGSITLSPPSLAPGQSATGTASKAFPTLPHGFSTETEVNIITVTASYGASRQARATVINNPSPPPPPGPEFTVTKRVGGTNAPATGQASLTLTGGGTAYYFYTVSNTGQVPFQIASALDDKLGPITFSPLVIAPGETATAVTSKSFGAVASETTEVNVITVTVQANQQTYGPKTATATVINRPLPPPPPSLTVLVCPTFVVAGGTITAENASGQQVTLQWNGTGYFTNALTAGEWSVILSVPAWDSPHTQTITIRDDESVPDNSYQQIGRAHV